MIYKKQFGGLLPNIVINPNIFGSIYSGIKSFDNYFTTKNENNSKIKFDTSRKYINKSNLKFGKGVWYIDSNNDGKFLQGVDELILLGLRYKLKDGSYLQYNSDGSITKLSKFDNFKDSFRKNFSNISKFIPNKKPLKKVTKHIDAPVYIKLSPYTYKIKLGDSLFKIAKKYGISLLLLINANNIDNPNVIHVGLELIIPNTESRSVYQDWDTTRRYEQELNDILKKYGNEAMIKTYYTYKGDNSKYIIDDKVNNKLKVYLGSKLLAEINVSHGANKGEKTDKKWTYAAQHPEEQDDYTVTHYKKGTREIDNGKGNMTTPAGIFYTTLGGTYHSYPSFIRRDINMVNSNNPNGIASSIHVGDINGNSNGCTRVTPEGARILSRVLGDDKNVPTYILPQNLKDNKFFIRNGKINFTGKRRGKGLQSNGVSKGFISDIDIKFDGVDDYGQSYGEDRIQKVNSFIDSLKKNKKVLMDKLGINDDTYNELSLAALGIMGRETSYGIESNFIKDSAKLIGKMLHISSSPTYKHKYRVASGDNNSIGLTQMRIKNLSDESKLLLKEFNITKKDLVYDPEKSATATMIALADEYKRRGSVDDAIQGWNWKRKGYKDQVKNLIKNDFTLYSTYYGGSKTNE